MNIRSRWSRAVTATRRTAQHAIPWRLGVRHLPLAGLAACLSVIKSTEGGRREARRECLAAARNAGWRVVDISAAEFKGSGRYDVNLLVAQDSVPQQSLACHYDIRNRVSELRKPGA